MSSRKIIITQDLDQVLIDLVNENAPGCELIIGKNREIWGDHVKDAEIIAGWKGKIAKDLLLGNGFPSDTKLRWVQSWTAGINSLPLKELKESGILLTTANGVHSFPISETIFAFMLGLTRKIPAYIRNQQSKTWNHSGLKHEIHGKTIGIFGVGSIGKETAKLSKAFGMKVLGFRRSGKPEEYVDQMYTLQEMNEVLPECDYVVVTLPLTPETHQLFGAKQFTLMKPSAFFINIGRGDIAVESELVEALQSKTIAGAGLDVFEQEPLSENSPLWDLDNVIITPHTSGSTEYYDKRVIEDIFIPNLRSYLKGETLPINLVDYDKGY